MSSTTYFLSSSSSEIQPIMIILEVTMIIGMIWLICRKKKYGLGVKLTESEEEEIILAYQPEGLVSEENNSSHFALNPRILQGKAGLNITVDGISYLNFASHDYLGFSTNKDIEEKVMKTIDVYGVGACGPRGFYGTAVEHLELEHQLAKFMHGEDSIVYSYGFATLASAIPAYAKKADIIFVDEKRNFAIQQGLEASKSMIKFFKHNDVDDLENILKTVQADDLLNKRKARRSRRYLVVEGIYINTGEICPLPDLIILCKKYKLRIFIDESISFGVLGGTGRGVTEYFGVPRADVDLIMGSLEYTLASVGGFCVGSRLLIDHQNVSGQGYCFSASLPPLLVTAALEALRTIQNHPESIHHLNRCCRMMHKKINGSLIINRCFVVSGNKDSPVHVLVLKQVILREQQESETVIGSFIQFCSQKKIAITRAAFLPTFDRVHTPATLRIITRADHTELNITYLIQVLEEACTNIFFNCKY